MKSQATGLLLALLSLTGGALSPRMAAGAPAGVPSSHEAVPFDLAEAEALVTDMLRPLASVSHEDEVSWRVTEILLDPKLQHLLEKVREHFGSRIPADLGAIPDKPEYAQLIELCRITTKLTSDQLVALGQQELPTIPSVADIIYAQDVHEWVRLGTFDGISALFCLGVLLEFSVEDEAARILAPVAKRGFESMIRMNVALMEREGLPVSDEIADLDLGKLDIEALEAEQELRDQKLAEWFNEA